MKHLFINDAEDRDDDDPGEGDMQFTASEASQSVRRLRLLNDTLPFLASDITPVRGGIPGYMVEIACEVLRDGIIAMCLPSFPNDKAIDEGTSRVKQMARNFCRMTLFASTLRIQNVFQGVAIEVTLPLKFADETVPAAGICFEVNYFTLAGLARNILKEGTAKVRYDPGDKALEIKLGTATLNISVKVVEFGKVSLIERTDGATPVPTNVRAIRAALSSLIGASKVRAPSEAETFILIGEGAAVTVGVPAPACYQASELTGVSVRLPRAQWKAFNTAIRRLKGRSRVHERDGSICIEDGVITVALKSEGADVETALKPFDRTEKDAPSIRVTSDELALATYNASILESGWSDGPLRAEISAGGSSQEHWFLFAADLGFLRGRYAQRSSLCADAPASVRATVSNKMLLNASCVNTGGVIELKFCERCIMFVDEQADYRFRYLMPHMDAFPSKERAETVLNFSDGPVMALLEQV